MNSAEIDRQIDELPQNAIDDLLEASYKEKRLKAELGALGATLFLLSFLSILHVSFYIGNNHPPMLHRIYLLLMAVVVVPYATVKIYKSSYASVVIRATRRVYVRTSGIARGA